MDPESKNSGGRCSTLFNSVERAEKGAKDHRDSVREQGSPELALRASDLFDSAHRYFRDGDDARTVPAYEECLKNYRLAMNAEIEAIS